MSANIELAGVGTRHDMILARRQVRGSAITMGVTYEWGSAGKSERRTERRTQSGEAGKYERRNTGGSSQLMLG